MGSSHRIKNIKKNQEDILEKKKQNKIKQQLKN